MPKIIVTSRILKRAAKTTRGNYVKYIATREGVEKVTAQQKCEREIYTNYVALRPGSHGLFTASDDELVLDRIAKEVENHRGNVWSHIVSLRRDDAERIGFNCLDAWQNLVRREAEKVAAAMKISSSNFVWYAAFHNKETNPHIHMIAYSKDMSEGFLTKQGIDKIRSAFANDIYRDELQNLYQEQTVARDMLRKEAGEQMKKLAENVAVGECGDTELLSLIQLLQRQLTEYDGKKVYGYLPKKVKETVDEIVKRLAENPVIAEMYENWCRLEREKASTYTSEEITIVPLWEQEEFKPIRNMVVSAVAQMSILNTSEDFKSLSENKISSENIIQPGNKIRIKTYSDTAKSSEFLENKQSNNCILQNETDTKNAEHCAFSLLRALAKMLSDDFSQRQNSQRSAVDSKLKSSIRRKKQALGIKEEQDAELEIKY